MKRTFEIEFPDDNGPLWINTYCLLQCLITDNHTSNTEITVKDITNDDHDLRELKGTGTQSLVVAKAQRLNAMEKAMERAARVWCDKKVSDRVMDPEFAEAIARALYEVWFTGQLDADIL